MAVDWAGSWATDVRADQVAKAKAASQGNSGSTLMRLAVTLGTIADSLVDKVEAKAKELDATAGKDGANENLLTAQMQALTQIMKMFIEAMSTVIKSMGEGNSSVARKT